MKIGILVSGNLGLSVLKYVNQKHEVIFVMTDKLSNKIISYCSDSNINFFIGNPRNENCSVFIRDKSIEVLISVNYLFIIEQELINLPQKIAFNIHGSILPKYRGRTPHVWSIINNEVETGITAHLIDQGCDTGDVIEQVTIPIRNYETGADILQKYNEQYIPLINKVLNQIETDSLQFKSQDNSKATYFDKRTPDDGIIDWNWQKERIYNWVRALARPYPGAFTYYDNIKIMIHKVEVVDEGFNSSTSNGLILRSGKEPIIKTPNGAIRLLDWEFESKIELQQGKIFYERH